MRAFLEAIAISSVLAAILGWGSLLQILLEMPQ